MPDLSHAMHHVRFTHLRFTCLLAGQAFNLDALATPIEDLVKEASIMKAYKHPNVLPLHCAFVTDAELWMVIPYCEGGSVAHMLRYAHPDGLDEHLIAAIMKQVGGASSV